MAEKNDSGWTPVGDAYPVPGAENYVPEHPLHVQILGLIVWSAPAWLGCLFLWLIAKGFACAIDIYCMTWLR